MSVPRIVQYGKLSFEMMVILVQWPGHTSERGPCKLQFFLNILSKSERNSLIKDVFGASILSICGFSTSFRGDFGWSTWISIYGKIKKKKKLPKPYLKLRSRVIRVLENYTILIIIEVKDGVSLSTDCVQTWLRVCHLTLKAQLHVNWRIK